MVRLTGKSRLRFIRYRTKNENITREGIFNLKEAYLESERRFQSLFEISHLAILIIDPTDGRIIDANSAACSFYGYQRDILKLKYISDINLLTKQEIYKEMMEAKAGGKNIFYFPHRLASGEVRFVEVHSGPIVHGGREVLYSMIHDITERKRADDDLAMREEQLRTIFEGTYDGIFLCKLHENSKRLSIREVNEVGSRMLGCSKAEVLYNSLEDIMPDNILPSARSIAEDLIKRGSLHFNTVFLGKGGQKVLVEVSSKVVSYLGGNYVLLVVRDITEKNKLEKEINQKNAYFRQLFDNSPLAIAILNNEGRIIEVNKAFTELFQYLRDEVSGKNISQVIAGGLEGEKTHVEIIRTGQFIRKETMRRRKDGSLVNVSLLGFPIYVDKEQTGIYAIYEDITERKNADRTLQENEARYRQLVENSPDCIIVHRLGKILFVNTAALYILGVKSREEVLQKSIYDFISPKQREHALNRVRKIMEEGRSSTPTEYKIVRTDGSVLEVEAVGIQLIYEGEPAVQSTMRNVTERNRDLHKASAFQKHRLETRFPLEKAAYLEIIYLPVQMISGDFFHFYKVDDSRVVGILGDVSGKGITAALSISGLKVLFYEIVSHTSQPLAILNYLNKEVARHLDNEYVAAACFAFDFANNTLTVASAGINNYSHYKKGIYCVEETITGPYLGMFTESQFETREIYFNQGDRFYFYTDGLEQVMGGSPKSLNWFKKQTINEQRKYLERYLKKPQNLIDDATWLAIEIK